jgi:hypothetical protein
VSVNEAGSSGKEALSFNDLGVLLEEALSDLSLGEKLPSQASIFEAADRRSRSQAFNAEVKPFLPLFEKELDLGYFSWTPQGPSKSLHQVAAKDIQVAVGMGVSPATVVDVGPLNRRCPMQFCQLPAQSHDSQYPFNPGYIVPAFAAKSPINLSSVEYVLGGSALNMLSTMGEDQGTRYLVQQHGNLIFVAKHASYIQNYADAGFQFERLVCGGKFEDQHDRVKYEHMQVLNVGARHRILFCADVDATEKLANDTFSPVEIKTSNSRYWGNKVALQMVSSGSLSLVQGIKKNRGTLLDRIEKRSLTSVFESGGAPRHWIAAQDTILAGLDKLSSLSKAGSLLKGKVFEIHFHGRELRLKPSRDGAQILPPVEVVEELVGFYDI